MLKVKPQGLQPSSTKFVDEPHNKQVRCPPTPTTIYPSYCPDNDAGLSPLLRKCIDCTGLKSPVGKHGKNNKIPVVPADLIWSIRSVYSSVAAIEPLDDKITIDNLSTNQSPVKP